MITHRNNVVSYRFGAEERLKSRKQIEKLFQSGKAFFVGNIKTVYLLTNCPETETPYIKVGFSIPKKKVKSAVIRNRIRRKIKEAWRLQKHELKAKLPANTHLHCFFIYNHYEIPEFNYVKQKVSEIISQLSQKIM